MKTILTSKNEEIFVDDDTFDQIGHLTWGLNKMGYARHGFRSNGVIKQILLHRLVLAAPAGVGVDHINGIKTDNQRKNLRFCTAAQNQYNRAPTQRGTSIYKGVSWVTHERVWRAQIKVNRRNIAIGSSSSEVEAAYMYDQAARTFYGEFARCNFPEAPNDNIQM